MTGQIPSGGPPGGPHLPTSFPSEKMVAIKRKANKSDPEKDERVKRAKANVELPTQSNSEKTLYNRVSCAISDAVSSVIEAKRRAANLTIKQGTYDENLLSQFTKAVTGYLESIYIGDAEGARKTSLDAIDISKWIFNKGIQDKNGDTLLHISCRENMVEVVISLLEQGGYEACLNKSNKSGETPLNIAWNKGHQVIYDLLLQKSDLADRLINIDSQIYLNMESNETLCMPSSIARMSKTDEELFGTFPEVVLGMIVQILPESSAVIMDMINNEREIPEFLQNITYLDLNYLRNLNECWQVLKICKKVASLKLPEHFKTVDYCIEVIEKANLPNLLVIDLSNTKLTDRGLSALARMNSLEELNFNNCKTVAFNGFNALTKLPNLRELNFSNCMLGEPTEESFCAEHPLKEEKDIAETIKTIEDLVRTSGKPAIIMSVNQNSSKKNVEDIIKILVQDTVVTICCYEGSSGCSIISRPARIWKDSSILFVENKKAAFIISCK